MVAADMEMVEDQCVYACLIFFSFFGDPILMLTISDTTLTIISKSVHVVEAKWC